MKPTMSPTQHSVLLVTAGYDHTIRFWEALSGICSRTIQHQESQVNRLSISPDKRFLAAAGNQHVKLYDITSGVCSSRLDSRILEADRSRIRIHS